MTTILADRPALEAAYRQAQYWILATPPLQLTIDRPEPRLDALLRAEGVTEAALLTAENPGSRPLSADGNRAAQRALQAHLDADGFVCLPACSRDPAGQWPEESGVLVLGIAEPLARHLALRFGQNAFLWCAHGRAPRLAWTAVQAPLTTSRSP